MIFVGDIAAPSAIYPEDLHFRRLAPDQLVIANLEGAIAGGTQPDISAKVLFNHPAVLSYLQRNNVGVVSLANNHVFDISPDVDGTIKTLNEAGIGTCGAGRNLEEAARAHLVVEAGRTRLFLAYGWAPVQCRPAKATRAGVNPLDPRHVIHTVTSARRTFPDATITVLMHWNFELEIYPMPMHRRLAFQTVDAGADAVIGCHSHCVQGIEVHKGAPIVYGLGNWFLAQGLFFGGKLRFPGFAARQLAFQWNPETAEAWCHWFEYSAADHSVKYLKSDMPAGSDTVKQLTPFSGMDHRQYVRWFKANRRKRALLPVYAHPGHSIRNRLRDSWVAGRQHLINASFAVGLKGGPK